MPSLDARASQNVVPAGCASVTSFRFCEVLTVTALDGGSAGLSRTARLPQIRATGASGAVAGVSGAVVGADALSGGCGPGPSR